MQTNCRDDLKKLEKLGVSTPLELAMILPVNYESTYINKTPFLNETNTIEVEIITLKKTPKVLTLQFFCKTWSQRISGVVFKPSFYHEKIFRIGSALHVRGRIKWSNGWIQILQPQVVKEINRILPKYKSALQNRTVISLIKKYVGIDTLVQECGMEKERAELLHLIHNPTFEFYRNFQKGGFGKDIVKTLKYCEIFLYLKKLSKKSKRFRAKSILNGNEKEFLSVLPFSLTNDQKKVISEIKEDFLSGYASKRVVMGDVGCGKTVVMLASVMIAYPKKSLLMAPTTVLAKQIYEEAKKYLPLHVKAVLVTNETPRLELDKYDFIVGTHALLYRELPEVDLVMVDEQHRFGTNQRAKISSLMKSEDKRVHFLQFSATPIPRTLAMMHSDLVDFSYIKELPFKKDIETKIIGRADFGNLMEHIKNQIKQNHQTIIVYPLVEESENIGYQSIEEGRAFWESKFEKVYVTFGKDKDKSKTLERFREDGNILITTTVIEVGISLPKLTTIVLVAPERLGLASLHQLRGRVSRNGLKGFCYLFTNKSQDERLENFCSITDGFELAELDLQYRKSGDILEGISQSGVNFKWFDMASDEKILKEAKDKIR